MTDFFVPTLIILMLIILNGLFVAAEFAIIAAPRPRMERLAGQGNKAAWLVAYVQADQRRQDVYIATAQLGISAASVGLGMYGEHVLAHWLGPLFVGLGVLREAAAHSVAIAASIGVLTYLHIVLGEMVPKSLALFHPDRTAMAVSRPMLWSERIAYPAVAALNGTGNLLLRLMRVPLASETAHIHSPEELQIIVQESQETGAIDEEESEILLNLLHFSDMQIRKVMVPRTRVVGIDIATPMPEVVAQVVSSRHTRYPIYEESLDHVKGMLHVKELFRELRRHPDDPQIASVLREPVFVPEQMTVEDLLMEMRRHEAQIAVVIDEYGGTSGIVSLEDVLEEIFGEVQDEFDEEEPAILVRDATHVDLLGTVRLDEFCEEFDFDLERPDVDTIGGLILAELGRPAAVGDVVQAGDVQFTVTELEGLAVGRAAAVLPARGEPDQLPAQGNGEPD